ncbi:MAG TPA: hypothetical protein VF552_11365 [Allosphingosinicella sp.]|jgi:hypothetical protein
MRRRFAAFFIAAAAVATASPALATQGLSCRPASGTGPQVDIVLGSLGIVGVSLTENGRGRTSMGEGAPLAMQQAWIDDQRLWIDIADGDLMRPEGRLRLARLRTGGEPRFAGTLTRGGRVFRLRCVEG